MSGNVAVDTDPADDIKCTKVNSLEKIVAAIRALNRCIRHKDTGIVYDERGLTPSGDVQFRERLYL